MIEVITERRNWNDNVKNAVHSDFYHTYFYHDLSKKEGELPILLKYTEGDSYVLLPLLIREIDNSAFKDATSVYGYAGALCSPGMSNFDFEKFHKELNKYFSEHNIISVFSRLHPYLSHQEEVLKGLGDISNPGDVIYIDLFEPIEIQRANYSSRLKTHVNKAARLCTIIEGETEEHIQAFIDIYYENMNRVNANDSYFFEESYFYELMASPDFKTELSLAVCNETQEIIAGAMFIKTDNIVQYHLSGIKEEFLNHYAIKLIIDDMRVKSSNEGYQYLNLGGGRSSKKDSLYTFKSSFSKTAKPFKLWKYIVNQNAYDRLSKQRIAVISDVDVEIDKEYFPAYRRGC